MSPDLSSCWIDAPAKVNLTLEILGLRPDGYHELRSALVPLAFGDRVELRPSPEIRLDVVPEGVRLDGLGPADRNLAVAAAGLLRRQCGVRSGVAIRIIKRIPIGGGLGGGSADAAAVLVGLDRFWNLRLPRPTLMALGAELGSDVPALLHGGAVCMEGRGERVRPLLDAGERPGPGFWMVVANPGIPVPTGDVYRRCAGVLTASPNSYNTMRSSVRSGDVAAASGALFNGLEAGVFAWYREVRELAAQLRAAGGLGVLLSGSGGSVFALVSDREHGERVRGALPAACWSVVTKTLPDGVMAAHGPLEP